MAVARSAMAGLAESIKERLLKSLASADGLDRVEALISEKLASEAPQLQKISSYLFTLGGKRVRPVLTLLTARACGGDNIRPTVVDVAAGIELIHMATLLHDDIIDHSPVRRHHESPYKKFGTADTLLTGDFLLVRAFSLCARLDRFVIDATEKACVALTEGEILETPLSRDLHSLDSYLEIARKKTASLFWLATLTGSHLSDAPKEAVDAFGAFGDALGIAFQMVDDVLDIISDEQTLGKQVGIDLREQKPSLVNVLWLKHEPSRAQDLLRSQTPPSDRDVALAVEHLRVSPAIEEARALASQYADTARLSLACARSSLPHPHHPTFDTLDALVSYAISRMV